MATLTLRPSAPGDVTTIPYQEPDSGAHWDKVDDVTPDEGATTVYGNVGWEYPLNAYDLYNLPNHTTEYGLINFVKVYVRHMAGYEFEPFILEVYTRIKTGGSEYEGDPSESWGVWTTISTQYNTNPQAGGAWTWAQIDALQAGVRFFGASFHEKSGGSVYCTQVYIEVDYTVGWLGKISTVVDPAKIAGLAWTAIKKVKSVVSRA